MPVTQGWRIIYLYDMMFEMSIGNLMEKIPSGGVYCEKCNCCISAPRKRKNYQPECRITCAKCHDEKFSDIKFSLKHWGNDIWTILNEDNQTFCGKDGWVAIGSSYYELTPDCREKQFSYEELKDFILNQFDTNLF
jgi:hypothetical protein